MIAFGFVFSGLPFSPLKAQDSPAVSIPGQQVPPANTGLRRDRIVLRRHVRTPATPQSDPAILRQPGPLAATTLRRKDAAANSQPASSTWQPVGPLQVSTPGWNLVTGRVSSIAVDPSDSSGNTVYVGTTGGGIWKSTNAAGGIASATFVPLTDDLSAFPTALFTSLSLGAISVQPGGTGVVLGGTGDPNNAVDSWYGAGLLRSPDGGNSWTLNPFTSGSGGSFKYEFSGNAFAGFAWSTTTPDLVVAAITDSTYGTILGIPNQQCILGLYYSTDAGVTWQLATIEDGSHVIQSPQTSIQTGNAATSVVWNPMRQKFYAAVRYHGYYESADGITWSRLLNQPGPNLTAAMCPTNQYTVGSPGCPVFRGALAVQPVTGDLFALTVDENNLDQGLWRDACNLTRGACASGTVQFGTQIADQPLDSTAGDGTIPQADYNLVLAAVPSQQDTLLFAGTTDIWRCSLANSCVWRNTTNTQTCAAAQVAPAQHAIDATFGANGLLYFGNDGGLWRTVDGVHQQAAPCSPDDARHFQNLNGSLGSLAEVQSFSEDPNAPSTWLAALGILGTAAPSAGSASWNQVLGGEGNFVAIDPAHPENWYATSEFGVGINTCNAGTSCNAAGFGNAVIGAAQTGGDIQTIAAPWILDPQDPANLILGTCRVWRGPANGNGWSQSSLLSGLLDGDSGSFCNGNAEIRSLAAGVITAPGSPPQSEQIYAGMAGSETGGGLIPGHVFTATVDNNAQASTTAWNDLYASPVTNDLSNLQFNRGAFAVSSIYVDPHDLSGQTVYVTIQGYSSPTLLEPLMYGSSDGGAHWTDFTSNLPRNPANSVTVDPNNANIVYVALDSGVEYTENIAGCAAASSLCWNVFGDGLPNAPVMSLMTFNAGATQVLRAATYGRGIWQADLATAGVAPTSATLSPASLSFAAQSVQTVSAAQTVTLTATGTLNLNISSVASSGDFSKSDNCSGKSLAPQSACQIQVTFDPSQPGARQGTLTVFANVAGGQLAASLAGTGLAPGDIVLTPSSLAFAATTVGATAPTQSITVANTGGLPENLTAEAATGDFSISANTCASTLPAQTACQITIAFTPTASGARSGVLTVTDALGTQTAPLSGTGQAAATDAL